MRVERNWHPCQSDPHPPGIPRFLNWFHPATLSLSFAQTICRFLESSSLPPHYRKPPPSFSNRQTGGYIIFSASPTAQWVVHRSISRSVHPWPCPQPQRSRLRSERPETTLDHCRLLDASYAVVMSWNMERKIMGRADCACRFEMREFNSILRKNA